MGARWSLLLLVFMFFILSIFGFLFCWTRFLEPRLLFVSRLHLPSPHLKKTKIVHFTDLHFPKNLSHRYLSKLTRRIQEQRPDIIVFTGDFLCCGALSHPQRLKNFLCSLSAPLGCYCTLGNHDYAHYVTRDLDGSYRIATHSSLFKPFLQLFSRGTCSTSGPPTHLTIPLHEKLVSLLEKTPFTLLHNETKVIPIGETGLNLAGVGEYSLGCCHVDETLQTYNRSLPGIILAHNPDTLSLLNEAPGELILCGHTHGEQLHFPFFPALSKKLVRQENPEYTRGHYQVGNKQLYVNRGIGGHKPYRFLSPPEILSLTVGDL